MVEKPLSPQSAVESENLLNADEVYNWMLSDRGEIVKIINLCLASLVNMPLSQMRAYNAIAVITHFWSMSHLTHYLISWRVDKFVKIFRLRVDTLDWVTWL